MRNSLCFLVLAVFLLGTQVTWSAGGNPTAIEPMALPTLPPEPGDADQRLDTAIESFSAPNYFERQEKRKALVGLGKGMIPAIKRRLAGKLAPEAKYQLTLALFQLTSFSADLWDLTKKLVQHIAHSSTAREMKDLTRKISASLSNENQKRLERVIENSRRRRAVRQALWEKCLAEMEVIKRAETIRLVYEKEMNLLNEQSRESSLEIRDIFSQVFKEMGASFEVFANEASSGNFGLWATTHYHFFNIQSKGKFYRFYVFDEWLSLQPIVQNPGKALPGERGTEFTFVQVLPDLLPIADVISKKFRIFPKVTWHFAYERAELGVKIHFDSPNGTVAVMDDGLTRTALNTLTALFHIQAADLPEELRRESDEKYQKFSVH